MRTAWFAAGLVAVSAAWAAPALAQDCEGGACRIERGVADEVAPSSTQIRSSVDAYLGATRADASLVGGPGSAGYDGGFWIRGGMFLMKINLTIQARYEAFRWDDEEQEPSPGGDLSGFSIPRVTLKFSGDATCNVHYYVELEFGHAFPANQQIVYPGGHLKGASDAIYSDGCREAWIEYEWCPALAVRMGLVKLAATRQLMTPPEMQQFVDVSMASAWIGSTYTGYSDRNRDYGIALHGALGCDGEWSYLITVTNGDGPRTRNVLDVTTNDNLAYSARVNWDVKGHMGYEEGALRQHECEWLLSLGAWAFAYTDINHDKAHTSDGDVLCYGFDVAAGYGGWSATAAYNWYDRSDADLYSDVDGWSWLAQIGYLFPCTAWEIAARYSAWTHEYDNGPTYGASEFGFAVNYYIDGHSDKLTLDAALISGDYEDANYFYDVYTGYQDTGDGDAVLIRFQWQLAL
jgi:hypothetical protein